jgi:hypothetical protein
MIDFLKYWLQTKIKPIWYKIWRYIAFPVIFLLWVLCIGVYQDLYWKLSLYVILPAIVLDLILNLCAYFLVEKKKNI